MRQATLFLGLLAIGAFVSAPAQAVTIGGEVYGQFSTHAMDDWNDLIKQVNQGGANFDEINSSISGGIGGRMWASPNVMIAAAWEPLFASTSDGDIEVKLNGNSFLATIAYMVAAGANARYGVGVGGGLYSLSGEVTETGFPDTKLEGSTFGFHILGLAEWLVSPGFGITAGAGYRAANIDDTEVDGQSQDPKQATDYSGVTGRLGVVFYLPNSN